ncbi:MAG TPA: ROK family protein [Candidatus Dormibacteraeota bacterium]|nr:ROK family protein [Candidatus Dormibacteraeota bacterium]
MIAGIDLGGTQVRVAVARSDGRIIATSRNRTDLLRTPRRVVEWSAEQIARLADGEPVRCIGIGAPGPTDPARGVLINPPNLAGWRNVPLAAMVREIAGCPAYLENDANLAGLGEHRHGAGKGTGTMVYITWSTGVGAGLILDGRLFSGAHGTAGEVGHMILDPKGPLDGCGQRGCVEAYCGGGALARETGESAAALFDEAAAGDGEAATRVREAATQMGYALINVANLFDPEVVVMGGGVTRSWRQVAPVMEQVLRSSPFIKPSRRPKLRRARLGDRAGQVGAVEWAREHL